ncbi:putative DNA topoisomerase (ATP-hydrolyzing) [Helianthus annuus]|nr:putative DNA topoisomerase (ATP-hydrolyzing) [Helianthus annuus]
MREALKPSSWSLQKSGMICLEDDVVALMNSVVDLAGCLGKNVKVNL